MNEISFYIPYVTGVLTVIVGFAIGYVTASKENKKEPQRTVIMPPIHIPPARVSKKKKEPPKPPVEPPTPTDLGPVDRPTAEELEREENPQKKAEEEEMEKSLGEVFGNPEDIEAMFTHKRKFGIATIFKKGQYAI